MGTSILDIGTRNYRLCRSVQFAENQLRCVWCWSWRTSQKNLYWRYSGQWCGAKDRDIIWSSETCLYPHMTVYDNMAFGLKLRKYSRKVLTNGVNEAAEILKRRGISCSVSQPTVWWSASSSNGTQSFGCEFSLWMSLCRMPGCVCPRGQGGVTTAYRAAAYLYFPADQTREIWRWQIVSLL